MKRCLKNLSLRCSSILYVCSIGNEMQTKWKKYKETSEDKAKCHLPFMARLDSNVYKTFVMFFKSFQFPSELCFLGESSFEARIRVKILIFLKFHQPHSALQIFFLWNYWIIFLWSEFFMKQLFYETIFYTVSRKRSY